MILPNEISFLILSYLSGNDILRLRRHDADLPEWLQFLSSDRALYLSLKQIQDSSTSLNSARSVLTTFEETTSQELKEREALWRQIPRKQSEITTTIKHYNNSWTCLQGRHLIIPSKQEISVLDLVNRTTVVHQAPFALIGVMTDELLACHSGTYIYAWKNGVCKNTRLPFRPQVMTGKHSKVACLDDFTLSVYDYDTDELVRTPTPVRAHDKYCLVWADELWVISVSPSEGGFTLHADGATSHSKCFAQELNSVYGVTARSTGDRWQIIVEFQLDLYSTTRSFIFDDLSFQHVTASQLGGGRSQELVDVVWRNEKVVSSLDGVSIGNAFLRTFDKPRVEINDSFLVTISKKAGVVVCNVLTFDETTEMEYDIGVDSVDGRFYWRDGEIST